MKAYNEVGKEWVREGAMGSQFTPAVPTLFLLQCGARVCVCNDQYMSS